MLEQLFPNLQPTGYVITSPVARDTNCIAWAAGINGDWWWPDPMGVSTWPASVRREETVASFIEAFESLGYVTCNNAMLEPGYEKVALFAVGGVPKHAARQLPNGRWSSKLGILEDVEHALDGLIGVWYGQVVQVLKRPAVVP